MVLLATRYQKNPQSGFPTFQTDVQMQSSIINNVLQGFHVFFQKGYGFSQRDILINKKHLVVPLGVSYQYLENLVVIRAGGTRVQGLGEPPGACWGNRWAVLHEGIPY